MKAKNKNSDKHIKNPKNNNDKHIENSKKWVKRPHHPYHKRANIWLCQIEEFIKSKPCSVQQEYSSITLEYNSY